MAPVMPQSNIKRVEFFEQHLPAWQANAGAIGLTSAMVTTLQAMTANARSSYDTQQIFKNPSQSATQSFYDFVSVLSIEGSEAIAAIKLKAAQTNDPNVYTLAQIPPPALPTPAPPPVAPTNLTADPNADGTVTLEWKGSVANHTFFSVWRKLGVEPSPEPWVNLGSIADKTFLDTSIPTNPFPAAVTYRVNAQRENLTSPPSAAVQVTYGGVSSAGSDVGVAGTIGNGGLAEAA